jgi:hypothetical protein
MEDRRAEPRLKERLSVTVMVPPQSGGEDETSGGSWEATSVDISISGVVVSVAGVEPEAFQPDVQVRLGLDLPEPWGQIRTLGTIKRVKPAMTEKKMVLVGVEFSGMATSDTEKLREFLHGENHI